MILINTIDHKKMLDFIDVHYYGLNECDIDKFTSDYQSNYYGNDDDACFEIYDNTGALYYAVFKNFAHYPAAKKSKSYLLFNGNNRVLINVGGMIYRYLIEDKKILPHDDLYQSVMQNDASKERSMYFQSLASPENELMIIVDCEGIACLNWEGVLWKKHIEWAYAGYLKLLFIENNCVITEYEDLSAGKDKERISFDIHTGVSKDLNE